MVWLNDHGRNRIGRLVARTSGEEVCGWTLQNAHRLNCVPCEFSLKGIHFNGGFQSSGEHYDTLCGYQHLYPAIPVLVQRPMNKVTIVTGMRDMHGLKNMNFPLKRAVLVTNIAGWSVFQKKRPT